MIRNLDCFGRMCPARARTFVRPTGADGASGSAVVAGYLPDRPFDPPRQRHGGATCAFRRSLPEALNPDDPGHGRRRCSCRAGNWCQHFQMGGRQVVRDRSRDRRSFGSSRPHSGTGLDGRGCGAAKPVRQVDRPTVVRCEELILQQINNNASAAKHCSATATVPPGARYRVNDDGHRSGRILMWWELRVGGTIGDPRGARCS